MNKKTTKNATKPLPKAKATSTVTTTKTATAAKAKAPARSKAVPKASLKASPTVATAPLSAHCKNVWKLHLEKVARTFQDRGFETSVVETVEEAGDLVLKKLLPASKAETVSFGGSVTMIEAGLLAALRADKTHKVLDTADKTLTPEAMIELRRQSLLVDFFISSVNAITEKGQLVLLDGTGNRCAALQFGPKKVVLLIGRNKLCPDMETALERIKNVAAPANAMRLNRKTPCVKTGYCMDCASPDRICSTWTVTERSAPKGRIHLVLINEDAGY